MKKIILLIILFCLICISLSGCFFRDLFDSHRKDYLEAVELYENGEYKTAADIFSELAEYEYKDSQDRKQQSLYFYAEECFKNQNFEEAINIYESLGGYLKSSERKIEAEKESIYVAAVEFVNNQKYEKAKDMFESIREYKNSENYIWEIIYTQARNIMQANPDKAVEMFYIIKDYRDSEELINGLLYNKASDYMRNEEYLEAVEILKEIKEYKNTNELLDLCNKNIKYDQAIAYFNHAKFDLAYTLFQELTGFLDSSIYLTYIEAGKDAEAKKYGEAAKKYLSILDFLDSSGLYEKYIYIYYDEQYQLGNKDLFNLAVLPFDENTAKFENEWRAKRIKDLKNAIKDNEILTEYYDKAEAGTALIGVTGTGIYVNDNFNDYGVKDLISRITEDLPLFFLADSPEKVRYVMSFKGSAKFYAPYEDATLGYETSITVIIKDTVTGQIIFSEIYNSLPPLYTTIIGDVYASYDFLREIEYEYDYDNVPDGKMPNVISETPVTSDYEKDILPVLKTLYE